LRRSAQKSTRTCDCVTGLEPGAAMGNVRGGKGGGGAKKQNAVEKNLRDNTQGTEDGRKASVAAKLGDKGRGGWGEHSITRYSESRFYKKKDGHVEKRGLSGR